MQFDFNVEFDLEINSMKMLNRESNKEQCLKKLLNTSYTKYEMRTCRKLYSSLYYYINVNNSLSFKLSLIISI